MFYTALVFPICLLCLVSGYPGGPPAAVCDSMRPSHGGIQPQSSPPMYTITASRTTYAPGDIITVNIVGPADFKGFFLQARRMLTGRHTGMFSAPSNSKLIFCGSGTAVSHSTRQPVGTSSKSFQWTAPFTNEGDIQFVATIVQNFSTYWLKIPGPTLKPTTASPQMVCELPTQPMSLVELSRNSFYVSWKSPTQCETSCQIEFKVRAAVGTSVGNRYVSIGFSKDVLMGDDSVVDCIEKGPSGTVSVQASFNTAGTKGNQVLTNPNEGLEFISGSRTDGVLECVFKRSINTADNKIFDLAAERYRLFVAVGNVLSNDFKTVHSLAATSRPVMSAEKIDFLTPGSYKTLT